jgi:hypothetical protein
MRTVPQSKRRAFVNTCAIVALSVYGIPRIPRLHPGLDGTFSTIWILFAALAVAANLYFLVGADKERSQQLERQEADPGQAFSQRGRDVPSRRRAL